MEIKDILLELISKRSKRCFRSGCGKGNLFKKENIHHLPHMIHIAATRLMNNN